VVDFALFASTHAHTQELVRRPVMWNGLHIWNLSGSAWHLPHLPPAPPCGADSTSGICLALLVGGAGRRGTSTRAHTQNWC